MRKALQAEAGKADMEAKVAQLEQDKIDLENEVQKYKAKCGEFCWAWLGKTWQRTQANPGFTCPPPPPFFSPSRRD